MDWGCFFYGCWWFWECFWMVLDGLGMFWIVLEDNLFEVPSGIPSPKVSDSKFRKSVKNDAETCGQIPKKPKSKKNKIPKSYFEQDVQRVSNIIWDSPRLCEKILEGRIRNQFGLFPTIWTDSDNFRLQNQTVHQKNRRSIHPDPKTPETFGNKKHKKNQGQKDEKW